MLKVTGKLTIHEGRRSGKSMLPELVTLAEIGLQMYSGHELDLESFEAWDRYMRAELYPHQKVVRDSLHEAGNRTAEARVMAVCFDEASVFRKLTSAEIFALTARPLSAKELKPYLKNPKNKPFYRTFEGGKKWKF